MIIDCHGHVSAPAQLWAYKAGLLASRGSHGRGGVKVSDDETARCAQCKPRSAPKGHLDALHAHGTDVQLISPRPFQIMHSEKPAKLVHWFAEECHNIIHRQTQLIPTSSSASPACRRPRASRSSARCRISSAASRQLGFVGCLLNPDPCENTRRRDAAARRPLLVSALREALRARRPGTHPLRRLPLRARQPIRCTSSTRRTSPILGLLNSDVFKDFPTLKILVSHGGGAIPYQLGRFEARSLRGRGATRFRDQMRAALLRHRALHGSRARAAVQDRRRRPLPVRRRNVRASAP